jgi:hypothetical protein
MGRVIAIGPGGQAQAPARDDRCRPVIQHIREAGKLDELMISPPCLRLADAQDLLKALYRSARYYCSCDHPYCTRKHSNVPSDNNAQGGCPRGGQRISVYHASVVTITDKEGRKLWAVQFKLADKRESMRAVIAKYGPDPNQWPYFSKRKRLKEK